jgi:hypothetical protein
MEFGLLLFMVGVGLRAGGDIVETFMQAGPQLVLADRHSGVSVPDLLRSEEALGLDLDELVGHPADRVAVPGLSGPGPPCAWNRRFRRREDEDLPGHLVREAMVVQG